MTKRMHVTIRGAVQGVGFRPFIYRLAVELGLPGWISNTSHGVFIEVEGSQPQLEVFFFRIEKEKPSRSFIQSFECSYLDPVGFRDFEIRDSDDVGEVTAVILPDIASCSECHQEIFDPANRRYLYPFTNCTNCGPRFSIIEALPYDRPNTTMKTFAMCNACRHEYENPLDRRFHAQPNACPDCGPRLELWDRKGTILSADNDALFQAAKAIRAGQIVAVKGIGGFHLVVDAQNETAVVRLRERKHREEKPFALMYPSLESVRSDCEVSDLEERLLLSPESPIVLLRRNPGDQRSSISDQPSGIAASVAPGNPYLGVLLPYTPLHHILMAQLGFPIVATSGNRSDEPICTDEHEAVERLQGIADLFLVHNRFILRHMDDSVVRVMLGRELVLRRARGYAPLPVFLKKPAPAVLAVGGHLKNTVAMTIGRNVFISQHIGDLETTSALEAFRSVIKSFQTLYHVQPVQMVSDMHPDYLSTQYARAQSASIFSVQHHHAHVLSCMAENDLKGPVLGVAWDGTGFGLDETIWGGEFLRADESSFRRVATLRRFRLPGSARAIKEPKRSALGVLYEIFGKELFNLADLPPVLSSVGSERTLIRQMLANSINSPLTSSMGRLFDAVASLIGLRQQTSFEGQAAMELEFSVGDISTEEAYPFRLIQGDDFTDPQEPMVMIDWEPAVLEILNDLKRHVSVGLISARFHNMLAEMIVHVAKRIGEERVVLTGGCFQNRYLTERAVVRLEGEGFRPFWHQRVPPNDGGISLGQVCAAVEATKRKQALASP